MEGPAPVVEPTEEPTPTGEEVTEPETGSPADDGEGDGPAE